MALAPRSKNRKQPKKNLRIIVIAVIVVLTGTALTGIAMAQKFAQSQTVAIATSTPNTASSTPIGPNAYANISLIGKSAIVYDLTTGQALYAQDAFAPRPLASITKLLTLYAATSVLSPSSQIIMTPGSVAVESDAADYGFSEGETFRFEDLARLTLAASSNAGAEAITEAANSAKSTQTSSLMAGAAAAAGLTQTYAVNGTGLDESTTKSGGYGSAHDVAVLAGKLLQKAPEIAEATAQPSITISSLDGKSHTFANTDPDVKVFPTLLLSKTGYTDLAGGNLVVVYDAAINHPVAIVVLGSTESGRFADVQSLMKATLAHFSGTVPVTK
jgi:D-alanyl-D-alanine carboxypeptidase (penicillin-binding protein 5/6)